MYARLWVKSVLLIFLSIFSSTDCVVYKNPPVAFFSSEPLPELKNDKQKEKHYENVFENWSRTFKLYKGLEERMFVDATYHSEALKKAFAQRFPDVYGHGGEVTKRELVNTPGETLSEHTFLLSVYTPIRAWNDLDEDDSIWRLTLTNGSRAVDPKEIIKVKIDQNLKTIYPHIGPFDEIYLVRFPMVDSFGNTLIDSTSSYFEVRIASSIGTSVLNWKIMN